ncbi:MAG TPA: hypothetical protein VFO07_03510 [Roseiflexaceae bacterium]|nr:hypothetical protein [Roseiflexaceae bacterium]
MPALPHLTRYPAPDLGTITLECSFKPQPRHGVAQGQDFLSRVYAPVRRNSD